MHQVNPVLEKKKKTYDAGTGPVPDEADNVRGLFYPGPDSNDGYRNADAQLCFNNN
jgi:hypothetical protein